MNSATITQVNSIKQDARMGNVTMNGFSLTRLIHRVIREYGVYSGGTYSVDLDTLSKGDIKLLLSHLLSAEEYEDAYGSETYLQEMLSEARPHLEELIDDECFTVYCENMEEMGMQLCTHTNNDEVYWVRR